jgi:hypothetical protein
MTTITDVNNLFSWFIRSVRAAGCFVGAHGEIFKAGSQLIYLVVVSLILN